MTGLVAGVVILAGFVAWRLSEGPIALNFLTPHLEKAFAEAGTPVAIAQTHLVWNQERQRLSLRVTDLTLQDDDGQPALTLPESYLRLSPGALLRGEVAVSALRVVGADLRLTRLADGTLLGLGGEAPEGQETPPVSPGLALIDRLLDEGDTPLAGLQGIGLIDSRVVFEDRVTGETWTFPAPRIDLRREERGLSGEAELAIVLDGETAEAQLVFAYGKRRGLFDVSATVHGLSTGKLAAAWPDLAPLALLDSEVSGQINATLAREADVGLFDFALTLGPGHLSPGEGRAAIALAGGSLIGLYDSTTGRLELETLKLATGTATAPGPVVTVSGSAGRDAHGRFAALTLALDRVPAQELPRYWPPAVSPNGRAWVAENLLGGTVTNLSAELRLRIAGAAEAPALVLEAVSGGFELEDLSVAYLPPLPPATGISGRASLRLDGLDIAVDGAAVGEVAIPAAEVSIYGLDGEDHRIKLTLAGEGPLPALLALLDHPRLALVTKLGLPLGSAEGRVDFNIDFDFPLLAELSFEQIEAKVGARLRDVTLPGLWEGEALRAQSLTLALDNAGMSLEGTVALAGASFEAAWSEPFGGGERRVRAKSEAVPAALLTKAVPDLAGHLDGSLGLALELRGDPARRASLALQGDLTGAAVKLPALGIDKAAGRGGSTRFTARLDKGSLTALEDMSVELPGFSAAGQVAFSGGAFASASVSHLAALGQSLGPTEITPLPGQGWRLVLSGGVLDARPWLEDLESGSEGQVATVPLQIEAPNLERVLLTDGTLEQATLSFTRGTRGVERVVLAGQLYAEGAAGGRLTLALQPDAEGRRSLLLQSGDMGALLRALDIVDTVVGGSLKVEARAVSSEPGARLIGQVEGENYRLRGAPVLAKVLLAATLFGIVDALDSEGIPFQRLTGEIAFEKGVLSTPFLRAYGGALGITAEGTLDFSRDVIDLEGTIVPAYAINRVIGEIPLIGWIITGGDGGGLLAVRYAVSGAVSDPQVSVNPLSALTPGFLRGLFDILEGDGTPPPPSLYPEPPNR